MPPARAEAAPFTNPVATPLAIASAVFPAPEEVYNKGEKYKSAAVFLILPRHIPIAWYEQCLLPVSAIILISVNLEKNKVF